MDVIGGGAHKLFAEAYGGCADCVTPHSVHAAGSGGEFVKMVGVRSWMKCGAVA